MASRMLCSPMSGEPARPYRSKAAASLGETEAVPMRSIGDA